jgi:hypothetical protein
MAQQRCGQPAGYHPGRLRRVGMVGSLLLALTSCVTEKHPFASDRMTGTGTSGSTSSLVGTWEVTLIVTVAEDIQTWTTRWEFRADRTCTWRQRVVSALEGIPREELRTCEWVDANGEITVTWDDTGGVDIMEYSFAAFDRDRLLLQGVEYQRIL